MTTLKDILAQLPDPKSGKQTEQYAVYRLFCAIDDPSIRFNRQQVIYSPTDNTKYYIADVYFPQLNIVVEIDEPYHNQCRVSDKTRETDIRNAIGAEIHRIDCSMDLYAINRRIDEVAQLIKTAKKDLGNAFRPWRGSDEFTPEFHKHKEYLSIHDDDCVLLNKDAFAIFGIQPRQRCFAMIPGLRNVAVWCPKQGQKEWKNEISADGMQITETHLIDEKTDDYDEDPCNDTIRIVFMQLGGKLKDRRLHFVGVFRQDSQKSTPTTRIYIRIAYHVDLRQVWKFDLLP